MIVQKKINRLEPNNYILNFNKSNESFYLEETDTFSLPSNLYHDFNSKSDKVLTTFDKLNKNQGVLISGHKGTGKTILAKDICIKSKLPVLIINQPFYGDVFNSFIDSIKQEVVLFFDEFEKTYSDPKHQESLLTLMDGVYKNKILFIFTTNSVELNDFLFNRPSRIRYNFKFDSINNETLRLIIDDLLENKEHEEELIKVIKTLGNVGVDLVISLIEEVNIFDENPIKVLDNLNVRLEKSKFKYVAHIKDEYQKKIRVEGVVNKSPMSLTTIRFYKDWNGNGIDYECKTAKMNISHISDSIHFEDRLGNSITYTPLNNNVSGINNLNKIK